MDWRTKAPEIGSINELEAFAAANGIVLEPRAVATLRGVIRLRKSPPIHYAATEAARAAADFGLAYPITEPGTAWRVVRARVASALQAIAEAVRLAGP